MTWHGWDLELLRAMNIPPTRSRRTFLRAWAACEGGAARFNPLNTTEGVAGATNYNSAGVKNYEDALMGLAATLLTIRLPAYSALRHALSAPGLSAAAILDESAAAISTWGTNPRCIRARVS